VTRGKSNALKNMVNDKDRSGAKCSPSFSEFSYKGIGLEAYEAQVSAKSSYSIPGWSEWVVGTV
jgi:hypothetical protein